MSTTPTQHAKQAKAALQRVRDYINRAAGQHRRAIRAEFVDARKALTARTSAPTNQAWTTTP